MRSDRAQLEGLAEQLPEGAAKAQILLVVDSYHQVEGALEQVAQNLGVGDIASRTPQEA